MSRFLSHALKGREPMLIDPAKAQDFSVMAEKFGFTDMLAQFFGVAPVPYIQNGVGTIPIVGVIGKNLSPIEKMMGAVDVNDISMAVDLFAADPAVEKIAFNISSPGGTVTGIEELANKVRNLEKPTMAYTDTEMASAAYWISAASDRVISSKSATIGSIGVYLAVPDYSEAAAMAGIKMVVIKSGKFKGAGIEGTSLDEGQMANLQASVDEIHSEFKAAVLMKRKMVKADAMEGQTFSGKQAAAQGLVTGLADSFSEALRSF
jgi:signal peptide peptidase SppA